MAFIKEKKNVEKQKRPKSSYNGLTHDDLCKIGCRYLEKAFRCPVVICEPMSLSLEKPDCFGMRKGFESILLEAKISRSDFLKDSNKPFRNGEVLGIGHYRYYITPKGLLTIDDLPDKWGLLEVDCNGKVMFIHGNHPNKIPNTKWKFEKINIENERLILFSYLRRANAKIKKLESM